VETLSELYRLVHDHRKTFDAAAAVQQVFWIDVEIPSLPSSFDDEVVGMEVSTMSHVMHPDAPRVDGEAVMSALQSLFGLHPLTMGDITDGGTLDKVEAFDQDYTFIVAHEPNFNDGFNPLTDTIPVALLLLREAVVSIHAGVSRGVARAQMQMRVGRLPTNAHIFTAVLASGTLLFGTLVDQVRRRVPPGLPG
jgi:hypothetical protein